MNHSPKSDTNARTVGSKNEGQFYMLTAATMDRLAQLQDGQAAMIFLVIAQHANHESHQWDLSEARIAEEAGVSDLTVRHKVPILVNAGLIAVEPTFWIDNQAVIAADVPAKTGGGNLVKSLNANGKHRWQLVRPNRGRTKIEVQPVARGWNRYTLLLHSPVGPVRPREGTTNPQGWGQSVPRVGTPCPPIPDKNELDKKGTKENRAAAASQTPAEKRCRAELDELVAAFIGDLGTDPDHYAAFARKEMRDALRHLPPETTVADVRRCAAYWVQDHWWGQPGRLSAAALVRHYPQWVARGKPAEAPPSGFVSAIDRRRADQEENSRGAAELRRELGLAGPADDGGVIEVQADGSVDDVWPT